MFFMQTAGNVPPQTIHQVTVFKMEYEERTQFQNVNV